MQTQPMKPSKWLPLHWIRPAAPVPPTVPAAPVPTPAPAVHRQPVPRYLFLVKIKHKNLPTIYEVRQYPSAVDAVIDALLRYDNAWPVTVRPLGGAL